MKSFFKTIKSLLGTTNEALADDNKATSEAAALSESYNQISQLVGEGNTQEALKWLTELQGNEDYTLQLLQKRFDSNGKTENALVLLQKAGYPEATALYGTYNAKKRRLNLGMLQESEWAMFQKELYQEILTWKYVEETTSEKILSATDKVHIRQLLQLNKTNEVLHFCKDFGNSFLLLGGQYTQIVKKSKMGLMTKADEKQELEDIKTAIERLIA